MQKNPNYNPNDPTSMRYITSAPSTGFGPILPAAPASFGELFKPFVDPFKAIINNPKPIVTLPKTITPAPNMSFAQPQPNMSVAPKGPVVTTTINTPSTVLPNNTQKTTTVKAPLAPTPAQTAGTTTPPTIPTTPSGAIDYLALAKAAGAAGTSVQDYIDLVKGQATPGTTEMDTIYKDLGIPGLLESVYTKPSKTTEQIYQDYYTQSGLGDVKAKIATLDTELKTIRDGYTTAIKEHQDNPWLSASTRSAKIAREKDIYGQREANTIALRQSYLDQYDTGVSEVEKAVGRVSGDLEKDRSLNADKLNYLLTEAERRAGLKVTDAAKTGLRYGSDFLKSKSNAEIAKENRSYNQQAGLIKLKASLDKSNSVGAIVEKALKSNPTGAAYINGIQNALGADTSEQGRNFALQTMSGKIANGDIKGAQEYLIGVALSKDPKARDNAIAANTVVDNLTAIKTALNAYVAKTGNTNLLKGNMQTIQQKLGMAGDPEAVAIKSMITDNLQAVRSQITGAAWGKSEDNEYKTTNANLNNSNRLNMALIDTAIATAQRKNDAAIGSIVGRDTYNAIFKAPATGSTTNGGLTDIQVANYITNARAQNIPDDQIEAYLKSKGVSL